MLSDPKSHWFYWRTGQTRIALTSMAASGILSALLLTLATDCSVWAILLAVLFDSASLFLAVVYLVALRWHLPQELGLQAQADSFALDLLIIPAIVGFVLNRGCTSLVAKTFGYPVETGTAHRQGHWSPREQGTPAPAASSEKQSIAHA